jgi:hypothetical protein
MICNDFLSRDNSGIQFYYIQIYLAGIKILKNNFEMNSCYILHSIKETERKMDKRLYFVS